MAEATALFWPCGTVYGTLLNFRAERDALGDAMEQAPYKGAPKAPVLYLKPHNTWSRSGAGTHMPANATAIEVGATVGMVIGPLAFDSASAQVCPTVAAYVLMNDLSLPHASFYRPPVRFKCHDGFLGLGPIRMPAAPGFDPALATIEVRINGVTRQSLRFDTLVRDPAALLAEVHAFVGLREGDVLMLGCAPGRPLAGAGDQIEILAPTHPALGVLRQSLLPCEEGMAA